jgi:uncharacterized protein (TIGR02117 family)
MRPLLKFAGYVIAGLVGVVGVYMIAAVVLGMMATNRAFVETADGIPVFIRTNGVHADLIVPSRGGTIDWTVDHPVTDMRGIEQPTPWIAFGWGDRDFFISTPTWSDLRVSTALAALSGVGSGAMHVEYIETPSAYNVRRIRLSQPEYERLATFIRESFARQDGAPRRIAPGYFDTDAFYEAEPVYTFWYTCNEWTRRALAQAGVRTPLWAPFDTALFLQLPPPLEAAGKRPPPP